MLELARKGFFSQLIVVPLFHRHRILTQVAADNVNIVKLLPPLIIGDEEIDAFVAALDDVLADATRSSGLLFEVGTTMARNSLRRDRHPPGRPDRRHAGRDGARTRPRDLGPGTRVLVTGGAGFVGSSVVRAALDRGAEVVALVEPGGDTANLDGLDVEIVSGDLRDPVAVDRAVAGCDIVFHVAALYRFWAPDPAAFYDINVTGTRHVLDAARSHGVARVVYTSTVGTLGLTGATTDAPVDERVLRPRRPPLRPVQAVEVRGRARGAAGRRPRACRSSSSSRPPRSGPATGARRRRGGPSSSSSTAAFPGYVDTTLNIVDVEDVAAGHLLAAERGRVRAELHPGGPEPRPARRAGHPGRRHRAAGPDPPVPRPPWPWPPGTSRISSRAACCGASPRSPWRGRGCRPPTCPSTTPGPARSWATRSRPAAEALERAARWFVESGAVRPERVARCTWPGS